MEEKISGTPRRIKDTFYPSGINIPLAILVFGPLIGFSILAIVDEEWWAFLILFVCLAFSAYLYVSTFYAVTENAELVVRSGPFHNIRIPVEKIRKIESSGTLMAGPALSMKRIIVYSDQDSVVLSPKEKQKFIDHLLELNPEIEIR